MKKLTINARREGYSPEQCKPTLTVGELRRILEDYDDETPIYLSHDNGYTYGSIIEYDLEEEEDYGEDEE